MKLHCDSCGWIGNKNDCKLSLGSMEICPECRDCDFFEFDPKIVKVIHIDEWKQLDQGNAEILYKKYTDMEMQISTGDEFDEIRNSFNNLGELFLSKYGFKPENLLLTLCPQYVKVDT